LCYSSEYDLVIGEPCCPGSTCFPWTGNYAKSFDNFCQFIDPLPEGEFCGNRVGICADGLSCIGDICMPGTTTTTSEGPCQQPGSSVGGAQCSYFSDGIEHSMGDPCCPGSECLAYGTPTETSYYKYCLLPDPLAEGDDCANKVGECGPNLECDPTEGVCKQESGLKCQKPGNALCKIAADGEDIDPPCCAGSLCLPWLYGTPSNFYCQKMELEEGEPCGDKVGMCKDPLDCIFDFCTTPTTIPPTLEPTTLTPEPCLTLGGKCWELTAPSVFHKCCAGSNCAFDDDHATMYCMSDKPLGTGDTCGGHEGACANGACASGKCP